jgi:hypothetical protein
MTRHGGIGTGPLVLLVLGALAIGWFSARRAQVPSARPEAPRERLANTDTVITAVRDLARLESVSFHMERVIDLEESQTRMFGMLNTKDAILLVAAGDVVAGIDLTKLHDGDVTIDPTGGRAQLRLPPPEILSVTLDSQHTYVHSRKTGLFARQHADLETRARQRAEDALRSAALESGILERSRRTTGQTLSTLLRSLGYERVELTYQE